MTEPNLPSWLAPLLPELNAPFVLSCSGKTKLIVTSPEGEVSEFDNLKDVHDFTHGKDLHVEDEVYDVWGDGDRFFGLTFPSGKNLVGMLLARDDRDRLKTLEREYEYSLTNHIKYQNNPDDFYTAYYFIDTHPAFWTCRDLEEHPWYWETSGHCQHVSQCIMKNDEGEVVVALETGCHVESTDPHGGPKAYTHHYHDYRLDTYAKTFEQSFIDLARLVDKFFYPDGSEKPDVDHEKPQWILDLEDRVKDFEESQAEED